MGMKVQFSTGAYQDWWALRLSGTLSDAFPLILRSSVGIRLLGLPFTVYSNNTAQTNPKI